MDLKKYFGITKSQYRFLDEYIRSRDRLTALRAGAYSTTAENVDKNYDRLMAMGKVQRAYRLMLNEKYELDRYKEDVNVGKEGQTADYKRLLDMLEDAIAIAKQKKNAAAMGSVLKIMAEMKGLYQPKKQAQKILQITIHEQFDENCQGGEIEYEEGESES